MRCMNRTETAGPANHNNLSTSAGRAGFWCEAGEINETAGWVNSTFVYRLNSKHSRINARVKYVANVRCKVAKIDFPESLNRRGLMARQTRVSTAQLKTFSFLNMGRTWFLNSAPAARERGYRRPCGGPCMQPMDLEPRRGRISQTSARLF